VPGALLGAALFAVHPLHVESVVWVIERKDVLSGLLFLAAFLAWLRYDDLGGRRRLAAATALQAGAMLAKSIAAALPLVLLLAAWFRRGRIVRRDLLGVAPMLAVTATIALFDVLLTQRNLLEATGLSPLERVALAGRALAFYAAQCAWPAELMLLHPRFGIAGSLPWSLGYAAAAAVTWALLWRARIRIGRGPVAGLTYFTLVLSPVLGLIDFSYFRLSFVADRFAYLAVLGPLAVLAGVLVRCLHRGPARLAASVLLVGLLGARATAHARHFHGDETLFRHAVASNPQAWAAWAYLAGTYNDQARFPEALACAERAVALRPDDPLNRTIHGRALLGLGRTEESLAVLEEALRLAPDMPDALNNRGLALDTLGRGGEAVASWEAAIREGPRLAQARSNLGIARARAGRDGEAEALFREAIGMRPDVPEFHSNLGIVLARTGRAEEAVAAYRRALALSEGFAQAHNNLGVVLDGLGRAVEAQAHYRRALALRPDDAQARANLERSLAGGVP
jgi:tetratricopeptide (TPR) repeat protein